MSTDYTPTTDEVREDYVANPFYPFRRGAARDKGAEFDQWLAAQDQQARDAERAATARDLTDLADQLVPCGPYWQGYIDALRAAANRAASGGAS